MFSYTTGLVHIGCPWLNSHCCIHCCLQDVDREQLSSTVLKLISSVASTAPTDDKSRDAVWHPTVTFTVSQDQYQDPLGFGTIDLLNMKLVRATCCASR
jgi:hypothetical protein